MSPCGNGQQEGDINPDTEWIGQYRIQSRGDHGRAITIPQVVAPKMDDSVVIWIGETDVTESPYLRLALESLSDSAKPDETFLGCRSVVSSGRGKRVVLPYNCDDKHFLTGSQVAIGMERSEDGLSQLKVIPKDTFTQAISGVV